MSEGRCVVVRIGNVIPHENADSLDLVRVWDYPVVIRRGSFAEGDLAIYVPVDSIVPTDNERFAFLGSSRRIKAKRLRGVFSMGLLVPAEDGMAEGDDVTAAIGVTRYEPPVETAMETENEPDGSGMPCYTDIEGLRRWPGILSPGEEVVVTEKIHGANGRFVFHDGRLWVGSRTSIKRQDPRNLWWQVAAKYDLATRLSLFPDLIVFGEVYGQVQDLKYGSSLDFAVFDVMELASRKYLDHDAMEKVVGEMGLCRVPILYRGPWSDGLRSLAEGVTTLHGADHVREGIVVRPVHERWNDELGRVILKLHGEGYLTRKKKEKP